MKTYWFHVGIIFVDINNQWNFGFQLLDAPFPHGRAVVDNYFKGYEMVRSIKADSINPKTKEFFDNYSKFFVRAVFLGALGPKQIKQIETVFNVNPEGVVINEGYGNFT